MRRAVEVYREVGYDGLLMPDHVPKHADDPGERQAYAFCYGYIRGLIQSVDRVRDPQRVPSPPR
jgi:mannonate dehydratase